MVLRGTVYFIPDLAGPQKIPDDSVELGRIEIPLEFTVAGVNPANDPPTRKGHPLDESIEIEPGIQGNDRYGHPEQRNGSRRDPR